MQSTQKGTKIRKAAITGLVYQNTSSATSSSTVSQRDRKRQRNIQYFDINHITLFLLPENLPSTDWPCKPSLHPHWSSPHNPWMTETVLIISGRTNNIIYMHTPTDCQHCERNRIWLETMYPDCLTVTAVTGSRLPEYKDQTFHANCRTHTWFSRASMMRSMFHSLICSKPADKQEQNYISTCPAIICENKRGGMWGADPGPEDFHQLFKTYKRQRFITTFYTLAGPCIILDPFPLQISQCETW